MNAVKFAELRKLTQEQLLAYAAKDEVLISANRSKQRNSGSPKSLEKLLENTRKINFSLKTGDC